MSKKLKGNKPGAEQTYRIDFFGIVQGVGFRPLVYSIAKEMNMRGWIANSSKGATAVVNGSKRTINEFLSAIKDRIPEISKIIAIKKTRIKRSFFIDFKIQKSFSVNNVSGSIPPDTAVCPECLKELRSPADRRYNYPLINCTKCGPRFSITRAIPYDRANTTMDKFDMCADCAREYSSESDRRFHAQPNSCWKCGPKIRLFSIDGKKISENANAVKDAAEFIKLGKVVAVKSIGGFHLCCNAQDIKACTILRKRKERYQKPLAVMVKDINFAKEIALLSSEEIKLLMSPQRPIVLARKKLTSRNPMLKYLDIIAPQNAYIGLMLPYTPMHYSLLDLSGCKALILTSGNRSDEPICCTDKEVFNKLCNIADYVLTHNREIYNRSDDPIVFNFNGKKDGTMLIRRSRGYAPEPIETKGMNSSNVILSVGAHQKNTFCISALGKSYVSQYIGDLDNKESLIFFEETVAKFLRYLKIKPAKIARDLHPDYLSSIFADDMSRSNALPVVQVQHHEAHLASVVAEHGIRSAIGFAFDGTGLGSDGKIWGGETFIFKNNSFERVGHLEYFPMPGGEICAIEIWRLALSLLRKYGIKQIPLHIRKEKNFKGVSDMLEKKINLIETSSVGRLFDAVSAILGLKNIVDFEAQAAMEMEFLSIDTGIQKGYNFRVINLPSGIKNISIEGIVKGIFEDKKSGKSNNIICAKFHQTIVDIIVKLSQISARQYKVRNVILSGGVFQNRLILKGAERILRSKGFKVFLNKSVPPNDGCISLGQGYLAAQRQ